jgi:hypothetical protein
VPGVTQGSTATSRIGARSAVFDPPFNPPEMAFSPPEGWWSSLALFEPIKEPLTLPLKRAKACL